MEINKVNKVKKLPKKINVCAYARVSTEKDAMLDSLANQVSYYSSYIQSKREWLYVGVFSDEAISGTKANRPGFQKMLEEARKGKIDLIITKSISRFARNTVTLLEAVRELKELNADVYFEEQRIHSISKEGELMLTILASYAQEEARSASENIKWRVKRNFEEGIPYKLAALGYRLIDGKIVVIPEEAKIVKLIYKLYLDGLGTPLIAKELNKLGYKTMLGNDFTPQPTREILRNITYTGDLLLQKKYKSNYIEKKTKVNKGELPQYFVEDSHEPIIEKETFMKVQELMNSKSKVCYKRENKSENALKGKIKCGICGHTFVRRSAHGDRKSLWRCNCYIMNGKDKCDSPSVLDSEVIRLTKLVLGVNEINKDTVLSKIKEILVNADKTLTFELNGGEKITHPFNDYSRKNSWTPEMKQKARERSLKQWQKSQ
jgi:DNA invertase Pin-like site-specific DNA recombinase